MKSRLSHRMDIAKFELWGHQDVFRPTETLLCVLSEEVVAWLEWCTLRAMGLNLDTQGGNHVLVCANNNMKSSSASYPTAHFRPLLFQRHSHLGNHSSFNRNEGHFPHFSHCICLSSTILKSVHNPCGRLVPPAPVYRFRCRSFLRFWKFWIIVSIVWLAHCRWYCYKKPDVLR